MRHYELPAIDEQEADSDLHEGTAYNFGFLDEYAKREVRRTILKAIAIPGYQTPYASRESHHYSIAPSHTRGNVARRPGAGVASALPRPTGGG